jgi:GNAT superfamily N-acetyltransferase
MSMSRGVPPAIVAAWLAGRSHSRGLPAPVRDGAALRVETDLPLERRRYVFHAPCEDIRRIAEAVFEPRVVLKICGAENEVRPLLPSRWRLTAEDVFMMLEGAMDGAPRALGRGYALEVQETGPLVLARVIAQDGATAASGRAVHAHGVFVYDQIRTDEGHQRRGLGALVMRALEAAGRKDDVPQVLAATAQGRALYETLGWRVRSPYLTAFIEG